MKQLSAISAFLLGLKLFSPEDFESWVDNSTLELSGKVVSDGSLLICRNSYTAVLFIERYPHKRYPPQVLYAQVAAWLIEHDGDRFDNKNAGINIDPTVLDAETAEVIISIDFVEQIFLVEDAAGKVTVNGKRWRLADPVIDVAETAGLENA